MFDHDAENPQDRLGGGLAAAERAAILVWARAKVRAQIASARTLTDAGFEARAAPLRSAKAATEQAEQQKAASEHAAMLAADPVAAYIEAHKLGTGPKRVNANEVKIAGSKGKWQDWIVKNVGAERAAALLALLTPAVAGPTT